MTATCFPPRSLARGRSSASCVVAVLWLFTVSALAPLSAATLPLAERLHAQAVDSFRQGRFPEAYGRFIGLANAGHPPSARYALWMCEQGLPLFGKDWDCAPHEVKDWARLADRHRGPGSRASVTTRTGR